MTPETRHWLYEKPERFAKVCALFMRRYPNEKVGGEPWFLFLERMKNSTLFSV